MENIPNNFRDNEAEKLKQIRKIDKNAAQIYLESMRNLDEYINARHDKLENFNNQKDQQEEVIEKDLTNIEIQKQIALLGTKEEIIEMLHGSELVDISCYENILALSLQDNDTELQIELFKKAQNDNNNPGTSFETGPMFFKYSTEDAVLNMLETFISGDKELLVYNQAILFDRGGEIRRKLLTKYSGDVIQNSKVAYKKVIEEANQK